MGDYLELALAHWPFLVAAGAFWVAGAALKRGPLSRKRGREVAWVRWVRRWITLPGLVLLAGVLVGAYAPVPVPEGVSPRFAWLYYLGAAVAPIVWHNFHREFKKFRGEPVPEKAEDDLLEDVASRPPPPAGEGSKPPPVPRD